MPKVEVSEDEYRILRDLKLHAPYVLMRLKSEAILLVSESIPIDVAGRLVDRAPSTILSWVRDWESIRVASIRTGHADNLNASKLTDQQRGQVRSVLRMPPCEVGLPKQFWDVPTLANWVYDQFEVVYDNPSSYHFLLHMAGLSFHKPEPRDKRRGDQQAIDTRMDQIRAEVDRRQAAGCVVFTTDEVRLEHEAIIRRAWCRTGEKTILHVDRARHAHSYIGFLNNTTGKVTLNALDWQNTGTIIEALTELIDNNPGKEITIVWDNARWHKSKELTSHLGPGNLLENIHLINLPPYCPDYNPIEHVWAEAKNNIANHQRAHFADTTEAFETYITNRDFPYRL